MPAGRRDDFRPRGLTCSGHPRLPQSLTGRQEDVDGRAKPTAVRL